MPKSLNPLHPSKTTRIKWAEQQTKHKPNLAKTAVQNLIQSSHTQSASSASYGREITPYFLRSPNCGLAKRHYSRFQIALKDKQFDAIDTDCMIFTLMGSAAVDLHKIRLRPELQKPADWFKWKEQAWPIVRDHLERMLWAMHLAHCESSGSPFPPSDPILREIYPGGPTYSSVPFNMYDLAAVERIGTAGFCNTVCNFNLNLDIHAPRGHNATIDEAYVQRHEARMAVMKERSQKRTKRRVQRWLQEIEMARGMAQMSMEEKMIET